MNKCPACGGYVMVEPEIGFPDPVCTECTWEEGGDGDFGFVAMDARAFCPVGLEQ